MSVSYSQSTVLPDFIIRSYIPPVAGVRFTSVALVVFICTVPLLFVNVPIRSIAKFCASSVTYIVLVLEDVYIPLTLRSSAPKVWSTVSSSASNSAPFPTNNSVTTVTELSFVSKSPSSSDSILLIVHPSCRSAS